MRRTCNPEKPVRIWHGAPSGESSAWFEHSIDNREAAGSTPGPGESLCGQVNRCHAGLISHASGVQLASPQPSLGESFNGRTAGLQPVGQGRRSLPALSADKVTRAASPLVGGFDSLLFHQVRQGGRCGQGAGLKNRTSTFDSCPWHQHSKRAQRTRSACALM